MKITKKNPKKSNKPILITGIILVAAILMVTGYFLWNHYTNSGQRVNDPAKMSPEEKQESDASADDKKQHIEDNNQTDGDNEQPASEGDYKVSLSAQKHTDGTVVVYSDLGSIPDGTCYLKITNGDQAVDQEASVLYAPGSSTCAGFSIPLSDLGAGVWTIRLTVKPLSGVTITQSITQEVR